MRRSDVILFRVPCAHAESMPHYIIGFAYTPNSHKYPFDKFAPVQPITQDFDRTHVRATVFLYVLFNRSRYRYNSALYTV